jgi:CRP-like cAMP-binding protein
MIEFFNYLNSLHSLSAEATAALMKVIRAKELRRGQIWLQEGAVCDKFTFVVKGLMKLYFETGSKEVILSFARENEVLLSAESYFEKKSSHYTIRCIEQTVVVYILNNDLHALLEKFTELNIQMMAMGQMQVASLESHTALLMLPARQRFEQTQIINPWMVDRNRLTDKLLAGYLGVGADAICNWRKG